MRLNAKLGKLGDDRGGRSGEGLGVKVNMTYFTYLESPNDFYSLIFYLNEI